MSYYVNEVRAGSTVSNPRARVLDTGEELKHEVIKGDAITKANVGVRNVTPQSEIVVFRFAPVPKGGPRGFACTRHTPTRRATRS